MIMTLNQLILKARLLSWQLSSGDIPLTFNGKPIDFFDLTLEGESGNYYVDIKIFDL